MKFYHYPKCSTCQKAYQKIKNQFNFIELIDIKLNPPTANEIKILHERSGLEIQKLFNTSGNKYKELNLKDKLKNLSLEEKYYLLASDGMLIKRPILVDEKLVLFGSRHSIYE